MEKIFTESFNTLLSLTNKKNKPLLNDKYMSINIEIINLLFKDLNQIYNKRYITSILSIPLEENKYIYNINKIDQITKDITLNENIKQTKTVLLFKKKINDMISFLNSITDENDNPLPKKIFKLIKSNYIILIDDCVNLLINNYDTFIWDQPYWKYAKLSVTEEIIHARFKPSGIKGLAKCGNCGSEEVIFSEKQLRRGDEGSTIKFQCLHCEHKWIT
jgi:DNA-directed RNA polymerase subunit M/transcription elongation factor TFIIS